jgi:hypothetical protein
VTGFAGVVAVCVVFVAVLVVFVTDFAGLLAIFVGFGFVVCLGTTGAGAPNAVGWRAAQRLYDNPCEFR